MESKRTQKTIVETFGEARAATVESGSFSPTGRLRGQRPQLQKIRIRNHHPGGDVATVAGHAGPGFHTWPSGHIDQTPDRKRDRPICPNGATHTSPGHRPGNRIRKNRCVLKEHRIGKAGVDIRDTRLCGVPSERGSLFPAGFPGFAPRAGMQCPVRAWERTRGGGIGSNGGRTDTSERDARWGMDAE